VQKCQLSSLVGDSFRDDVLVGNHLEQSGDYSSIDGSVSTTGSVMFRDVP
jgi:hypothetical protein